MADNNEAAASPSSTSILTYMAGVTTANMMLLNVLLLHLVKTGGLSKADATDLIDRLLLTAEEQHQRSPFAASITEHAHARLTALLNELRRLPGSRDDI